MRSVARFLIRLYPARWRARYGEEFEALLEDSSPRWSEAFDLLKGAIRMQLFVPAFPKLALMLSVAGFLTGLAVSFVPAPTYISQAELQVEGVNSTMRPVDFLMEREREVLSRTSLANIIQDPRLDLYREERAQMPLEDVIEGMRNEDIEIRIDTPEDAGLDRVAFHVAFAYGDRVQAQHTLQALVAFFLEWNAHGNVSFQFDVLEPPGLPVNPAKPNRQIFIAAGFVAGLVLATLIAIFRRRPPAIPLPAQTA